jgi:asparagine synthase (glutamine-hydrolysing)
MCGILGVVGRGASAPTLQAIRDALSLMRHRGPDDEGYLLFDAASSCFIAAGGVDTDQRLLLPDLLAHNEDGYDVVLAHRRLSIIDITVGGHQPMRSMDERYAIVLNGEIYNYLELRRDLTSRGYKFRTATDTEVVLAAYAEWGPGMLTRLVGMFAIAILDRTARTVLLARDPFGIKPLYWTRSTHSVQFASEISPLLSLSKAPAAADVASLYRYMRFGVSDGHDTTMFSNVNQLPAAHYLVLAADGSVITASTPYWVPGQVARRNVAFDDAAAELRHLLAESVRLHLRSDVPLGVCLSGGLDSTAITALIRRELGADAPIHAFSFLSDDSRTGEGPYVELAAKSLGLQQHSVAPSAYDLVEDLEALVRAQEQPFDSTSIYAQFSVFRLARAGGMTVMLDGQGSDELFGGYATAVSAQLTSAILAADPRSIRALATSRHMSTHAMRRRILLSALGRMLPLRMVGPIMSLVGEPLYPNWLNAQWFRDRGNVATPRVQGRGSDGLRDELLHFIQTLSLPRLLRYEDRNSMAFSIESRVPFCTVPLADFALSLPSDCLVANDGTTKAVLRRAVEDLVPPAILSRPKVGFETPERAWFTALRPWVSSLIASNEFRALPFLNHTEVERAIDSQLGDPSNLSPFTWRFLNVGAWARQFTVNFK